MMAKNYEDSTSRLTAKQTRFVAEYLIDLNATQAAIRAGYSLKTAAHTAMEQLQKPAVNGALQKAMAKREHRTEIKQDDVLREIACLSFSDITHYEIDDSGNVKLAANAPANAMHAVSSLKKTIRTFKNDTTEITTALKLWSKPDALNMTGKHLAMFTEKVEHSGSINLNITSDADEVRRRLLSELAAGSPGDETSEGDAGEPGEPEV